MAGFPSQYSEEQWQQARDLVAQGFTFVEVSDKLGMSYENVRKKAQREEWFVPATALAKAQEALAAKRVEESNGQEVSQRVPTGAIVAESIAEIGQKGQIHALRGMLPRFLKTFEQDSELLTKPVEDWKTAGSMVNIFSKLAGLDKPSQAVQVNVWGDGWGAQGAVPVDASEVEPDEV
jgi:ribosomal protein S1